MLQKHHLILIRNPEHGPQPPQGGRPAAVRAALYVPIRDSHRRGPEVRLEEMWFYGALLALGSPRTPCLGSCGQLALPRIDDNPSNWITSEWPTSLKTF